MNEFTVITLGDEFAVISPRGTVHSVLAAAPDATKLAAQLNFDASLSHRQRPMETERY